MRVRRSAFQRARRPVGPAGALSRCPSPSHCPGQWRGLNSVPRAVAGPPPRPASCPRALPRSPSTFPQGRWSHRLLGRHGCCLAAAPACAPRSDQSLPALWLRLWSSSQQCGNANGWFTEWQWLGGAQARSGEPYGRRCAARAARAAARLFRSAPPRSLQASTSWPPRRVRRRPSLSSPSLLTHDASSTVVTPTQHCPGQLQLHTSQPLHYGRFAVDRTAILAHSLHKSRQPASHQAPTV